MPGLITWAPGALELTLSAPSDAPVAIAGVRAGHGRTIKTLSTCPLVEVLVLGEGHRANTTRLLSGTVCGARLRYVQHDAIRTQWGHSLTVLQRDDELGLEVRTIFLAADDVAAMRVTTTVTNAGQASHVIEALPTLMLGALVDADTSLADLQLLRGASSWCAENRWRSAPLNDNVGLVRNDTDTWPAPQSSTTSAVGHSTWSTDGELPVGVLHDPARARAIAWQVEHNGPWRWEIGWTRSTPAGLSLGLSGPTWQDHQWSVELQPGQSFTTVPASVAVGDCVDDVIATLTRHRRWLHSTHPAEARPLLVFNDFMNTLMGDPTEAKVRPLVDAAADIGAEVFCIDAGWYDDGHDWWPSVGEWIPSTTRFPSGLGAVIEHIRARGLVPGLWVEPEVIGINSAMAKKLPDAAFLHRSRRRIVEHQRYFLDLAEPAARAHLDEVFDRLISDFGIGYFKLDYNVTPGSGPSDLTSALPPGAGLLAHTRGYLAWFENLRARHPKVIFENCGAGAMRQDFAQLERFDLQSTSDQQDYRLYAPIASAAPMMVNPEQAANWAYPQPSMTPEAIAFTMVTGLSGRLYLSGHLDNMDAPQRDLVREGVDVFHAHSARLREALPFWPLGLPQWDADAVALGWSLPEGIVLYVWWRGENPGRLDLHLPVPAAPCTVTQTYPRDLARWDVQAGDTDHDITLRTPPGPSARVLTISTSSSLDLSAGRQVATKPSR